MEKYIEDKIMEKAFNEMEQVSGISTKVRWMGGRIESVILQYFLMNGEKLTPIEMDYIANILTSYEIT